MDSSAARAPFHTTRWSVVQAAGDRDHPRARAALEELCISYWRPLYSFARRRGDGHEEAKDAVQDFFTILIEKRSIDAADPTLGKFRTYLLAAFQHYCNDARDRASAKKRGGDRKLLNLTFDDADVSSSEPAGGLDPARAFDRDWAAALLERVFVKIQKEYEQSGRGPLFLELKLHLTNDPAAKSYLQIAGELRASEGAVKVAAHRMRERFRECLRNEVAETVGSAADVDAEIKALFEALA